MHKIFLVVLMCIFLLTHHLLKISVSASDLSPSSASSLSSSAATSQAVATATADVTIPQSGVDASAKTVSIACNDCNALAKEISISTSSTSLSSTPSLPGGETGQENLAASRKIRSLIYPYGAGLYNNLYIGYGASAAYYYPSSYSYVNYPTFYKYWGVYNPLYGYSRVVSG